MTDIEETAELITQLQARAIVEAYRAGKEAGEAERDRLRDEMQRYLPVIERCENLPALWAWCTRGTGIATANGYRKALQEDRDG